ncbi:MAG: hypothetical protein WCY09_09400 [Candidatus Omnitrophota bacterium]
MIITVTYADGSQSQIRAEPKRAEEFVDRMLSQQDVAEVTIKMTPEDE